MKKQQKIQAGSKQKEEKDQQKKAIKKQVKILSGFFPVFLYFSVQKLKDDKQISQLFQKISDLLDQYKVKYERCSQLHLTVSKTLNILQNEISSLQKNIQKSLKNRVNFPIILLLKNVIILENFICLRVQKITEERLQKVTKFIGQVITNPYFENPIYHVSLFRLFNPIDQQTKRKIQQMQIKLNKAYLLEELIMKAGIKRFQLKVK